VWFSTYLAAAVFFPRITNVMNGDGIKKEMKGGRKKGKKKEIGSFMYLKE